MYKLQLRNFACSNIFCFIIFCSTFKKKLIWYRIFFFFSFNLCLSIAKSNMNTRNEVNQKSLFFRLIILYYCFYLNLILSLSPESPVFFLIDCITFSFTLRTTLLFDNLSSGLVNFFSEISFPIGLNESVYQRQWNNWKRKKECDLMNCSIVDW